MKTVVIIILSALLTACVNNETKTVKPESQKIDGYLMYNQRVNPQVWVDEDTGCQYWISNQRHAGQLGMSPRLDSGGKPMGCRG